MAVDVASECHALDPIVVDVAPARNRQKI